MGFIVVNLVIVFEPKLMMTIQVTKINLVNDQLQQSFILQNLNQ